MHLNLNTISHFKNSLLVFDNEKQWWTRFVRHVKSNNPKDTFNINICVRTQRNSEQHSVCQSDASCVLCKFMRNWSKFSQKVTHTMISTIRFVACETARDTWNEHSRLFMYWKDFSLKRWNVSCSMLCFITVMHSESS